MQYESLFEKSSALPQGCLTLQFVRCHHSDVAWSATDVQRLHEVSVEYFRKHGCNKNGRSVSCWIDCGPKGLAVRVKADKIALQPDRAVKYRLNLRRSVNKILKLRSSSPSESNGPLPNRGTSVVYVPVTRCSGLELHADFFLEHVSDPETRRHIIEAMPADSCIRIPSEPFCAVKMRVYGKGEPLLTSVSGKDVSISFMTRKKAEQCGVAESTGQVEEFFPPSKQPEIEEKYRETVEKRRRHSDDPLLEKNAGNPDVPPQEPDGTTSESTEKLGALSLLTACVGIAPDGEKKEEDCLPRNYRFHHKRSSVEPATVPGISSALEQSVHVVGRGNQTTLPDSVAENNTRNPNVPPLVLDGTIATFSRRESTEILGAPSLLTSASAGITTIIESKRVDYLQLDSLDHSLSSAEPTTVAVTSNAFKLTPLNSRQYFDVVRSGNQITLPNSVAEKNTGNPNVPYTVLDSTTPTSSGRESTKMVGAPSLLTASADIAPNLESKEVDCLPLNSLGHFQSSSEPTIMPVISNAFKPKFLNSRQSFYGVRSGNQNTILPNSVAEKNTGNPNVPPLVIDGTILSSSEHESARMLGDPSLLTTASADITSNVESKKMDGLPLNSLGHFQSSSEPTTVPAISNAFKPKLLNSRQSFYPVRSRNQITTLHNSVAEKNTGNPNVPHLVLDGTTPTSSGHESTKMVGASSLLTESADIAPNIESKKVDCLPLNSLGHFQSSSEPTTVPVISNAFKPKLLNSRQSFYGVRSGNQNTTLPNPLANERQIGEASVIPELPKSSRQKHPGGIFRAVAQLSEIDGCLKPRQQNIRSETIAATPQARVQKTDFVTVVEQRTMASTQPGLNRKRYRDCPTAVASPSEPKTMTILESNTPDLPPTTKNNAVVPSSVTDFDSLAPDRRQTVTTTASSSTCDRRLATISRQPTCRRHQFLTRGLFPSRLYLPIHSQLSYLRFPNSIRSEGMFASSIQHNKPEKDREPDHEESE